MEKDFKIQIPHNSNLQMLIDYYFFIDITISELKHQEELIIPFPRITFGYFFDHPFSVINHSKNETTEVDMVISKISTDQISVKPLSSRIKILGAHVKPYTLAFLTDKNLSKLPWLIKTEELFKENAVQFKKTINQSSDYNTMFDEVEAIFLNSLIQKDLNIIMKAIESIESKKGDISINQLSEELQITNRTLRNHFYKSVGCSPKEYIHLVKLKWSIYQITHSNDSLTTISYAQNYSDQAHFTNTVKNIVGITPKEVRERTPDFRFLQF